ncbi:MAG: hypothetical protein ACJ8F7_20405 [Gemmataceae bacterium]
MNLQHLKTFIWLRYRLRVNQLKRGGVVNQVIVILVTIALTIGAIGSFFGGLAIGLFAFRHAPFPVRMWVWDGLLLAFLFSWMIGLLTDLQRSDGLSLEKFLHLPVSPVGAFVINYVSSLFTISMVLFVPGMSGVILGQTISDGPVMLLAFPLLAALLLAVTALTYQFQGWLATLMSNPRKRRTVIVIITMSFVLVGQLPNLINMAVRPWEQKPNDPSLAYMARLKELNQEFAEGRLSQEDLQRQMTEATQEYQAVQQKKNQTDWEDLERTTRVINAAVPPGWVALGAADLSRGAVLPALLGGLGLGLVGSFSLWRAYRTTMRYYTGHDQGGGAKPKAPVAAKPTDPSKVRMVEWQLPGVPEQAAAVAAAAFRSLLRAPEAKIAMIVPVILAVVFGSVFLSMRVTPPPMVRPLIAFGAIVMVLVCSVQIAGNQFGFDRAGFRAYVLSPVPRRHVLLGKNLAVAPFSLGMIALAIVVMECLCPMRVDHFLAAFARAVAMYLLFCLLTNVVSIFAPIPIAAGAMKATQVKLTPVLAHFGLLFAFPLVFGLTLLPLGLEFLLEELTGVSFLPVELPLMLAILAGVLYLYRGGLNVLGRLLADREQKVLEIVTSKSE